MQPTTCVMSYSGTFGAASPAASAAATLTADGVVEHVALPAINRALSQLTERYNR